MFTFKFINVYGNLVEETFCALNRTLALVYARYYATTIKARLCLPTEEILCQTKSCSTKQS